MQLTRHDECHLHMFSSLCWNASNTYLVAFDTRRSVWAHLKSSLRMGDYVWYSNSLFLIQLHVKISVNSLFVCIQAADRTQPNLELDAIFLPPTFLVSFGFFNPLSLWPDYFFFLENSFWISISLWLPFAVSSDASGSSLPWNLLLLFGMQTVPPFFFYYKQLLIMVTTFPLWCPENQPFLTLQTQIMQFTCQQSELFWEL